MLKNKCIAILVADGFNEAHLLQTKSLLENAGGSTVLISASTGTRIKSRASDGGDEFFFDQPITNACAEDYDALLLPGGAESIQTLQSHNEAVQFVTDFLAQKRPVAALGEAAQLVQGAGGTQPAPFSAPADDADSLNAAGQKILLLFAASAPTETQKHTA